MATGKPPWSQQYQEVAVLYHIGTTKSHPPIPEHLSLEAKDFLLKCLQKEPNLRPTASDLLQHPFVTGENGDTHLLCRSSGMKPSSSVLQASGCDLKNSQDPVMRPTAICEVVRNVDDIDGRRCSIYHEKLFSARPIWEMDNSDEMCRLDDTNDLPVIGQSFNPMSEPFDGDWSCKFNKSLEEQIRMDSHDFDGSVNDAACTSGKGENDFTFPCRPTCEDDDEVTETKIRAFLDEKAQDLKKLQTPLYEFYNTMNASKSQCIVSNISEENVVKNSKLPPKSKSSPSGVGSGVSTPPANAGSSGSPGILKEIPSPWINEWEGRIEDAEPKSTGPINSISERRRKWKEELDQELQSKREMLRQAGVGGRTSSPNDKCLNRKASLLKIVSTGK